MRLVINRDNPAFFDGHGDIPISHSKGIVPSLRDYQRQYSLMHM
jgi:hypothetical protein